MSVSAADVQLRFLLTQGNDSIFRTVDGSNCDHNINVSNFEGRLQAYSLLRTRGVIRIALAVPAPLRRTVPELMLTWFMSVKVLLSV